MNVFLYHILKLSFRDSQILGSLFPVSSADLQSMHNFILCQRLLCIAAAYRDLSRRIRKCPSLQCPSMALQYFRRNTIDFLDRLWCHDDDPFREIADFPDISRPVIIFSVSSTCSERFFCKLYLMQK